jgi:glycosyltransferase involved in cell wall biosynthesis
MANVRVRTFFYTLKPIQEGRKIPTVACSLDTISVIIPTRNEAVNISKFLASLPNEVELVVIDASDDGTDVIVEQQRPFNTQVIRLPLRIAAARQMGGQVARGDWLVFSDADVAFESGYFQYLANYVKADAFYGPKYATDTYRHYSQFFNGSQQALHAFGIPAASGSNMGMRRDVFLASEGFRLELPVNEDTELMLRIQHNGYRVAYVKKLAVHSLNDRRLDRGVVRKTLHSISRNILLLTNLYIPLPRTWLNHDWGYWSISHANCSDY